MSQGTIFIAILLISMFVMSLATFAAGFWKGTRYGLRAAIRIQRDAPYADDRWYHGFLRPFCKLEDFHEAWGKDE